MTLPFFTIGHSNRTTSDFIALLRESRVRLVIDVRSMPRSAPNPQFDGDVLAGSLAPFQIGYLAIPRLGGLRGRQWRLDPSPNGLWRARSFRNYADYALGDRFAEGLRELRRLGGRRSHGHHVRRGGLVALSPPDHRRLSAPRANRSCTSSPGPRGGRTACARGRAAAGRGLLSRPGGRSARGGLNGR